MPCRTADYCWICKGKNAPFFSVVSILCCKNNPSVFTLPYKCNTTAYNIIHWLFNSNIFNNSCSNQFVGSIRLDCKMSSFLNLVIILLRICGKNGPFHKFLSQWNSWSTAWASPLFLQKSFTSKALSDCVQVIIDKNDISYFLSFLHQKHDYKFL